MKVGLRIKNKLSSIRKSDFYQTYKEELIVVPLLLIAFYIINYLLISLFPHGAFFDFYSEIETIVSRIVIFTVSLWTAHLALSVSFPKIYKFLHELIHHKFDTLSEEKKIDYAIKFILVFIIAAALVFGGKL